MKTLITSNFIVIIIYLNLDKYKNKLMLTIPPGLEGISSHTFG